MVQSRIAVLDIDDAEHDFGFATGHAVPDERPCFVSNFLGKKSRVTLIRLADGYKPGAHTDWAVIRFDKLKTKGLVRYTLDPIEDVESLTKKEFTFAAALGLSQNSQKCSLSILDFSYNNKRVVHDCRATGGQSGSPITRLVDRKPTLVGLHIGFLWMFDSPATGLPDRKGYINLLDQNTVNVIESFINESRS